MQVSAVADLTLGEDGRVRDTQTVPDGYGPDGVAHQHRGVGSLQRPLGGDRDLELSGGVLGMELQHVQSLRGEGAQHLPQVVGVLDETGHPVPGPDRCGVSGGVGHHPLDLDAGRTESPRRSTASVARRAKSRWQPGCGVPSWV